MKHIVLILFLAMLSISCKNNTKTADAVTTSQDDVKATVLKGDFVYYDGAAVLQTTNEIYGVLLTDKLEELQSLAITYKKTPTDMVTVEIKGKISTEKHETILWDKKIEITEIITVSPSNQEDNNTIQLGS